jgi:hypothetical protein
MEAKMRSIHKILRSVRLRHALLLGAFVLVTATAVLLAGRPAGAQGGFALPWYTMDNNGGGPSTGGPYALSGTAGQSDASPVAGGGQFTLRGGFWNPRSVYAGRVYLPVMEK